jgi:preprotein translocase subunit Sec63
LIFLHNITIFALKLNGMSKKDYYEILEIDRNATEQDIKKAYKKLSKIHHPDV